MESPSIWNFRPPPAEPETRTFTDPEVEGFSVTLTLRPMDGLRGTRAAVMTGELIKEYITGERDGEGKVTKEPKLVLCLDGKGRTPDEWMCRFYANLSETWAGDGRPPPLSEVMGWQEILYVGWFEIVNFVEEMKERRLRAAAAKAPRADEGNPSGDATAGCSEASPDATRSIPKSPCEETPFSALSNEVSGHSSSASVPEAEALAAV